MARWGWLLACFAFAVFASLLPREAQAHPLGNFTINHYSRIEFADEARASRTSWTSPRSLPSSRKRRLDADGDGKLSDEEATAYLDAELPSLVEGSAAACGNEVLPLGFSIARRSTGPVRGGFRPCESRLIYWPTFRKIGGGDAHYTDQTYDDRIGWREIVVQDGPEVIIENSTAP